MRVGRLVIQDNPATMRRETRIDGELAAFADAAILGLSASGKIDRPLPGSLHMYGKWKTGEVHEVIYAEPDLLQRFASLRIE